jgi:hypothetical protein
VHLDGQDDGVGVAGRRREGALLDGLRETPPRRVRTPPARRGGAAAASRGPTVLRGAASRRTLITSMKRIFVHSVWPWVMMGWLPSLPTGTPLSPSQQSSSTQRQPRCSTWEYCSAVETPLSWSPVRYVLWLELIQ